MKVILKRDVAGLGRRGETVEVKDGYARNYLIPRDLAVVATEGRLREEESRKEALRSKAERLLQNAVRDAEKIEGRRVTIRVRAGDKRVFGSVTPQDVADALERHYGVRVDKRKILLDDNLKELGVHEVEIQLHPQVRTKIEVEILAEGRAKNENQNW